jgi:hypothetical protein
MAAVQRFPLRFGVFRSFLSAIGMGRGVSHVELEGDCVRVRMGWAFRADIPLASVAGARLDRGLVGGIGVHGWRGVWLVNGAATGLVAIDVKPSDRGYVLGVPVRLRTLRLSVEDPEALVMALQR